MLVGYGDSHPQQVGELIGEVELVALLGRLLPVGTPYHARHLTRLLGKNRHVGQGREIAHADGGDPPVDSRLRLAQTDIMLHLIHINRKNK